MKSTSILIAISFVLPTFLFASPATKRQILANTAISCKMMMVRPFQTLVNPVGSFRLAKNNWLWNRNMQQGPMATSQPNMMDLLGIRMQMQMQVEPLVDRVNEFLNDRLEQRLEEFALQSYQNDMSAKIIAEKKVADVKIAIDRFKTDIDHVEAALENLGSASEALFVMAQINYTLLRHVEDKNEAKQVLGNRALEQLYVKKPLLLAPVAAILARNNSRFPKSPVILHSKEMIEKGLTTELSQEAYLSALYSGYVDYSKPRMSRIYQSVKTPLQLEAFQTMLKYNFLGIKYFEYLAKFKYGEQIDRLIMFANQNKILIPSLSKDYSPSEAYRNTRTQAVVPPIGWEANLQMLTYNKLSLKLTEDAKENLQQLTLDAEKDFKRILRFTPEGS